MSANVAREDVRWLSSDDLIANISPLSVAPFLTGAPNDGSETASFMLATPCPRTRSKIPPLRPEVVKHSSE